jgi:hypothetical protein
MIAMDNRAHVESRGLFARRNNKTFQGVLILALLFRVYICFFTLLPNMHKDSYVYFEQADTILKGGYDNYFPNGYPLLIVLAKEIAGQHTQALLLWLNIAMSGLTVWFGFEIGKKLSGRFSVGLLAAALIALFPSQINYVRWLTTETPTEFFLLGAFFFYYRKQFGWSGLFFGLSIITRTNVAPVFLLLLVAELIYSRRIPVLLPAFCLVPLLVIGFYCRAKTGEFSISGNNRDNILYAVTASGSFIDYQSGEEHPEITSSGKALHLYLAHLKNSPLQFIKQRLANLWELWGFYASSANGGRGISSRLILGMGNFFMLVLGLAGWWKFKKQFHISILILPFLVVTAIHTLLFAMPRYTYPVESFMILLACLYIGQLRFFSKEPIASTT